MVGCPAACPPGQHGLERGLACHTLAWPLGLGGGGNGAHAGQTLAPGHSTSTCELGPMAVTVLPHLTQARSWELQSPSHSFPMPSPSWCPPAATLRPSAWGLP